MAALSREETARAKFTFSIYDFDGTNKIDAFQLGNALRALNLNPSLKRISNLGGTIQRNEKMLSVDEFLAIYQEAKKDKQEGTFEDYMEVLQGYDKDRSGYISVPTLSNLLQGYGEEKLQRDEAEFIIEECGDPDYENQVNYQRFITRLMEGPEIKIPIALLRATETENDSGLDTSAAPTPIAPLSRKNTQRKSEDSIVPPPALNEELVKAKLSTSSERRGSDKPSSTLPQDDNEKGITGTSASQADQENGGLSSKPRSSRKSRGSVKKEDNTTDICSELAVDEVVDDISRGEDEADASTISRISSARSSKKSTTGKRSSKKASSPEASMASDTSGGDLTSARSSLKSGKSRSSTKTVEGKDDSSSVKAKLQQPLISLKTQGLIGAKK